MNYRIVVEVLDGPESVLGERPKVSSLHVVSMYSDLSDSERRQRISDLNRLVKTEHGFCPFGPSSEIKT